MKDNDLKEIQGHLIAKIRCCSAGNKVLTVPVADIFPLFSSFFLIALFLCVRVWVPCSTLCDPMDCTRLGSSVHGISEARILEWVAIPFSKPSPYSTLILQPSLLYSPLQNTHYGTDSEKREPCIPHKGCILENRLPLCIGQPHHPSCLLHSSSSSLCQALLCGCVFELLGSDNHMYTMEPRMVSSFFQSLLQEFTLIHALHRPSLVSVKFSVMWWLGWS